MATFLKSEEGLELEHLLSWHEGDEAVRVKTVFYNRSDIPVKLEMLSSFSFGDLDWKVEKGCLTGKAEVKFASGVWLLYFS